MTKIKLAIVGRPNVGKSALFNRICKKRISIVSEEEGVTRDRIYGSAEIFGKEFALIDTAGMDLDDTKKDFQELMLLQTKVAIDEADVVIQVVDAKSGITELDEKVAKLLLKQNKPITLAVNKMDAAKEEDLFSFYSLGIEKLVGISAVHGDQIAELLEKAFEDISWPENVEVEDDTTTICIVGRPNVGKSTLLNQILSEERSIVSDIAGTTRDAIDVNWIYNENKYQLIDTAGIRRRHKEKEVVDKFAFIRTNEAIKRSDICLLMIDAIDCITSYEKKIAKMIEKEGKGCIILINKWDLMKNVRMEHYEKNIREKISFITFYPLIFLSAKMGRNVEKIFPKIEKIKSSFTTTISTPKLNDCIKQAMQKVHPPMIDGKRLKVYYITQMKSTPPTFVFFVNSPLRMAPAYKKYLINQLRKTFPFEGAPLNIFLKGKRNKHKLSDQISL